MDTKPETSTALTYIVPFVTAAFGAFFGALSAFWLGSVKQKRDDSNSHHVALLQAQYALISQMELVERIKQNLLEPLRKDPDRHLNLVVFLHNVAPLTVPFKELTFMLDSDEPELLHKIHLAEQCYQSVKEALEEHNRIRLEFRSKHKPETVDIITGLAKVKDMPEHEIYMHKNSSDYLYKAVDNALPKLAGAIQEVGTYLGRNFKGKNRLKFTRVEGQNAHAAQKEKWR
jgi:hypothetical protein